MNENQALALALSGVKVKWTIKPPLCALKDGKFADCVHIDEDKKETGYCGPHYASVLAIEAARLFQKKRLEAVAK